MAARVKKVFDFRPGVIARDLSLQAPIYSITAAGGHLVVNLQGLANSLGSN